MTAMQAAAQGYEIWPAANPKQASRVIFEVPHAGTWMPDGCETLVQGTQVLADSDVAMDRMCERVAVAGATTLVAVHSRYLVDLNRAPDDVDLDTVPDHPSARRERRRGVIWTESVAGKRVLKNLSYVAYLDRIARWHAPYHRALRGLLVTRHQRFGSAILIAAHSMPGSDNHGVRRADIVPGTRGGTTCSPRIRAIVSDVFSGVGLSIRHDDPYRGGYATCHYGVPDEGFHAVQIEVNRDLYLDAQGVIKTESFAQLQALFQTLAEQLASG